MSFQFKSNISKVLNKTNKTLEHGARQGVARVSEKLVQAVSSFDDIYLVPVYSKSTVSLSLSGNDVDKKLEEDTLLSSLIAEQEQATTNEMIIISEKIIKEAFKK